MLFLLEGYNAMITGGSGAIGKAIALAMASQGANIAISGTRREALELTANEIKEKTGKIVSILECDLSNFQDTKNLIKRSEDSLGQIDILVNNAGIDKDKLFMKMTEEDLDTVMNINLKAPFILAREAVLKMAKKRYGRIINITSVVGFTGNPGQVNYCSSKAAIVGMSKAIALEYAKRGITVNCIAPGAIKSPMTDVLNDQGKEAFLQKIPTGEMGNPQDVAYAACFLASKEASYITGQTLHVNGGMFIA